MARSALAVQNMDSTGLTPSFTAADSQGSTFEPKPGRFLRVKNASGASINVTLTTPGTVDGLAIPDRVVAVPATTGDVLIGLGAGDAYRQPDGTAWVDYSAVTSVTVAVIQAP